MRIEELTDTGIMSDIVRSLLYYDIFDYPLTREELKDNCKLEPAQVESQFEATLDRLVEQGLIYPLGEFFSVHNNPALAERRRQGNDRAREYMKIASERSQFIMNFPFVKAVYLSGSISKNFMPEDGDIDYFVITEPKRLWIARTLLIMYKKIFLLNSRKFFCLNYFIDTRNLQIEEKNLFTATELLTLVPMCDSGCYPEFMEANQWARELYPNFPLRQVEHNVGSQKPWWSAGMKWVLSGFLGEWMDGFFMRLTMNRWKQKFGHFNSGDFDVAMKSRSYVSKHHPRNFQKRVMDAFAEKVVEFEKINQVSLKES
ncbi:nucleotidyltransferase domain-containing protein [bacterium SCSIO 12741]|nr:nucleotidyltransferase domain-containing protein [bacterium SCSIO 12741]